MIFTGVLVTNLTFWSIAPINTNRKGSANADLFKNINKLNDEINPKVGEQKVSMLHKMVDFTKSKPKSSSIFSNRTPKRFSDSQNYVASPTRSMQKANGFISENFKKYTMKLPARKSSGIFNNFTSSKIADQHKGYPKP